MGWWFDSEASVAAGGGCVNYGLLFFGGRWLMGWGGRLLESAFAKVLAVGRVPSADIETAGHKVSGTYLKGKKKRFSGALLALRFCACAFLSLSQSRTRPSFACEYRDTYRLSFAVFTTLFFFSWIITTSCTLSLPPTQPPHFPLCFAG